MLSLSTIDWLLIFSVPVVAFFLGRTAKRQAKDYIDYFLARRALGAVRFLAAFFGANLVFTAIFLVLSYETARRGWWSISVPVAFFLGTVLLALLYPRLNYYFSKDQTLHQALGSTFDQECTGWTSIRRWAAIWTITAFVGLVGIEYYGGILLFRWAGVPLLANITIAVFFAVICTAFTIAGGLRGVALADMWLDIFSGVGILLFLGFISTHLNWSPSLGAVPPSTGKLGFANPGIAENILFCLAALALFVPMPVCALDTWQRGVAWKERQNVTGILLGGATGIVLAAVVAILAGFYARQHGWNPDGSPPFQIVLASLGLPPLAAGLVVGGFVAAVLSTADELLNCCAYALLADCLVLPRTTDDATSARYIRSAKFYTGIFGFLAALIAVLCTKVARISDVFNVVAAAQVVFFVPLLIAVFRRETAHRQRSAALLAMLLAFGTALVCVVAGIARGGKEGQGLIDGAPLLALLVSVGVIMLGWMGLWLSSFHKRGANEAR